MFSHNGRLPFKIEFKYTFYFIILLSIGWLILRLRIQPFQCGESVLPQNNRKILDSSSGSLLIENTEVNEEESARIKPCKRGHIVAETFSCCRHKCFPVCPRAQHLLRTQILCPRPKNCFWFCSETFCVRNKCFPVCAAQETSWATTFPQQCVLVHAWV